MGVPWIETPTLQADYPHLSLLYEQLMEAQGCSLASSTLAAHENRATHAQEEGECSEGQLNALAYGELSFQALAIIFEQIRVRCDRLHPEQTGGIFVDVGSGSGKMCIAAAFLQHFDEIRGIELVTGLHNLAVESVLPAFRAASFPEMHAGLATSKIEFINGDITTESVDWSDADVVVCNCAVFDETLMKCLAQKSLTMKSGSVFVTTSRPLPLEIIEGVWNVVCAFKVNMEFGLLKESHDGNSTITSEDKVCLHQKV